MTGEFPTGFSPSVAETSLAHFAILPKSLCACLFAVGLDSAPQLPTVSTTPLISALAAQSGLCHYWHKITDRTFTGIYHANGFDLAMMIPYFLVLFVLAFYGLHRYW